MIRHYLYLVRSKIADFIEYIWLNYSGLEKYFFEVNEVLIDGAKADDYDIKVIQISDIHIRSLNKRLIRIAQIINDLQPDLIIFTGDCFERKAKVKFFRAFLTLLNTHIPKVAVVGNWEHISKLKMNDLADLYTEHNGTLLINNTKKFEVKNSTISISGLDDFDKGSPNIPLTISRHQHGDFHIVLSHCPEYVEEIIPAFEFHNIDYDLILSGHTHGGQINLFGYTPVLPKGCGKYVKGWFEKEKLYVSKGIGISELPIRWMAAAEIAVIKLKKSNVN